MVGMIVVVVWVVVVEVGVVVGVVMRKIRITWSIT